MKRIVTATCLALAGLSAASDGFAQELAVHGTVTQYKVAALANDAAGPRIDYLHARPLPMPDPRLAAPNMLDALQHNAATLLGTPGASAGGAGSGERMQLQVAPAQLLGTDSGIISEEFGTSNQPFTTNRVNALGDTTVSYYPYRAAGKLFFNIGSATYLCSASLIKPGVVVTAAHCVANFGQHQFYSNWTFVPAYNNGSAPYGAWTASSAFVMSSYYNGTDACAVPGVVCQDDVAVITLRPQSGIYAGNRAGWYGYGWNGYGFTPNSTALIDQLGFPVALDGGLLMQRNDSQGYVASSFSNNTVIGSLMTGGSSGGPWLVNLGIQPVLSGTSFGSAANRNVVVGVTSWGYTNTAVKQQGASPFTTGNIVPLVSAACSNFPGGC